MARSRSPRAHNSTLPRPSKPMARGKPITRTMRIKPRNAKRRSANWTRAYESPERVAWVASQPSVVSGYTPCENAHVRSGGKGRKADARWIVPLLAVEHRELHRMGKESFERKYSLDLDALAAVTELAWRAARALPGEHQSNG